MEKKSHEDQIPYYLVFVMGILAAIILMLGGVQMGLITSQTLDKVKIDFLENRVTDLEKEIEMNGNSTPSADLNELPE